jgi:hypothetical protein
MTMACVVRALHVKRNIRRLFEERPRPETAKGEGKGWPGACGRHPAVSPDTP